MPLFFRFNSVNAGIFPVKRRLRRYSPGLIALMPLFFWFNAVNAAIFLVNAFNAAVFPVQRR